MEEKRKAYLTEVVPPFTPLTAMEEASRCLLCHDAPCSAGCPAGTDPGKFIRSIRFRNVKGAVETIRENNILGATCARVCPYGRTCEEACSRTGIDVPIQIGRLQRFATDFEQALGMKVLEAPEATLEKVAVIGGGPAGLAAAARLAMKGYQVTIFEKNEKAGGVLTYGIVPGRLPQEIVDWEVQYVKDMGVEFVYNCCVGKDITWEALKEQGFKAFFLAMGLQQSKPIDIPGMDLENADYALDFLAGAKPSEGKLAVGEHVVVVGGGDVAMDCATTAKMLGNRVTVVYRRRQMDMPAYPPEVAYVQSLGVDFITETLPVEVLGENGKVTALKAQGKDGVSEFVLKADRVVMAIGQEVDETGYAEGLKVNEKQLAVVDEATCATSVEGVYAAGDVVNGGKTVVQAVAEGKAAADGIDAWLASKR
ncbi:FAD-dependent oxidoreductase [Anoxynatronum sibiricum]|uniref:FAD-dependent oxidoreductase n=1 Tax=Anoxynatronum sibiricum TaxID=210623 RepID=A0ABU9VXG9_9CLOT